MSAAHHAGNGPKSFAAELADMTGSRVSKCYQCGKCSAGCPMLPDMDLTPNQIMRLIQLDRREAVLRSKAIWYCASCLTCTTRCPQEVKIAELMDAARQIALAEKKAHPAAKKILAFAKAFLRSVAKRGRLHEMGMAVDYKLGSRDFLADLALAPKMLLKGKLRLCGRSVKALDELKKLFARARGEK